MVKIKQRSVFIALFSQYTFMFLSKKAEAKFFLLAISAEIFHTNAALITQKCLASLKSNVFDQSDRLRRIHPRTMRTHQHREPKGFDGDLTAIGITAKKFDVKVD
ncbi:TPA: hypothetical protein QH850_000684 [Enterobacter chengduensis]|nr:hypothetical protein [Enterobacter chengduensis]